MPSPSIAEVLTTSNNRTTSETLTTAPGTQVGDTLVVFYGSDFYLLSTMPNVTSTAGVMELISSITISDNMGSLKMFICPVGSAGPQDVVIPAHQDCDIHGCVIRIPETVVVEDFGMAFDSDNGQTAHVAPAVDSGGTNGLLLSAWLTTQGPAYAEPGYTVPGVMTEIAETKASPFSYMGVASQPINVIGSTGTRTATWLSLARYASASLLVSAPQAGGSSGGFLPFLGDG